jgi:8-hydroxy-5-deazaflavin:NADPH oxidoreductase
MNEQKRIAIIGKGNVGSALQRGWTKAGHDVQALGKDPQQLREGAARADVIVLAVPFTAVQDVVEKLGAAAEGKVLVDVTNALTDSMGLALGFSTSGAEELQKKARGAKVVKAFNTQFARHMDTGRLGDAKLTAFAAGDDDAARRTVLQLGSDIGFDMIDAGKLQSARYLEPLGALNIHLGYVMKLGDGIGLRLAKA